MFILFSILAAFVFLCSLMYKYAERITRVVVVSEVEEQALA